MSNPWLQIPLADYESHMQHEGVEQLHVLSEVFGDVLAQCRPESVAVLGIAGGNGLEHIDPKITHRVVGIDLNPAYLEQVAKRYPAVPGLELQCADLSTETLDLPRVELVHAALLFEHAGTELALRNAVSLVAPGGYLSVVLQLPAGTSDGVSSTPYASIQTLKEHFQFVDPDWFREEMKWHKYRMMEEGTRSVASGKSFWTSLFTAPVPKRKK